MNDGELLRIACRWLDEGPTTSSDRVVAAALAQVRVTPQRHLRPFERITSMKLFWQSAAVASLILITSGALWLDPARLPGTEGTSEAPIVGLSDQPVAHMGALGLAFSADGSLVYGRGPFDPALTISDASSGEVVSSHEPEPEAWGVEAFSPDGRFVAIGHERTKLFDVTSGDLVAEFEGCCMAAFSPDGGRITTGGAVYDVGTGALVTEWRVDGDATFSPDGTRLLVAGRGDGESPSKYGPGVMGIIVRGDAPGDESELPLRSDDEPAIWHILGSGSAWSPDGAMVAIPTESGDALVWDARTGELLHELRLEPLGLDTRIRALAFSPDSRSLAAGTDDGTLLVLDLATPGAMPIIRSTAQLTEILSVAFSPDGERLLTGSMFEGTRIWGLGR